MAKIKLDKKKIRGLEKDVTKLVKDEIKDKGLVDTGSLLKSISTNITFNGSDISIEVSGNDYYKYLDDKFSITKDAFSGPAYDKVVDEIGDVYIDALEKQLNF